MYSAVIDVKERRDAATADVVGAYLDADMDRFTLMKLMGEAVEIMLCLCESYRKFVTYKNDKLVLYLNLKKALYRCVQSVLLWNELFANTLKDLLGFELSLYNACVASKMIDGSQCTIMWCVDDNKISHIDPNVV
jgi:hypothetical protein